MTPKFLAKKSNFPAWHKETKIIYFDEKFKYFVVVLVIKSRSDVIGGHSDVIGGHSDVIGAAVTSGLNSE